MTLKATVRAAQITDQTVTITAISQATHTLLSLMFPRLTLGHFWLQSLCSV